MKLRSSVVFYVNNDRHEVGGDRLLMNLSDYLRYERSLVGTKVVCAEGDCGACTVLLASVHELDKGKFTFKSVNCCIMPILSLDGCQIVTVEGLKKSNELHPVQKSMLQNFGSQCGYCTPGFVCAMTSMIEDSIITKKGCLTEKRVKNHLTGNLCRCTGYEPIIKAALAVDLSSVESMQQRYHDTKKTKDLKKTVKQPLEAAAGGFEVFLPSTMKQALIFKNKNPKSRIIAGATDLGVLVNKGRLEYKSVMSLQNIESQWEITKQGGHLSVPGRVSLSVLQKHLEKKLYKNQSELHRMLNIFASPQIKNAGTLVGNVVNASPISDTIPFLLVNDAVIEIQNHRIKRLVPIENFFLGYKKVDLKPNEIVTAIRLPLHKNNQISKTYKVSLRKDLDISAVTMALRLELNKAGKITTARLAFGGVGPVVQRLTDVEDEWQGQTFTPALLEKLSTKIINMVTPLSDVRGSKEFRLQLCRNLLLKCAHELEVTP